MQDPNATKKYTTFRAASTAFNRAETMLKMIGNFLDSVPRNLADASLQQLTNFKTLTAMDFYGRTREEIKNLVDQYAEQFNYKIEYSCTDLKHKNEASSLSNLRKTAWNIPKDSHIKLLFYNSKVVGVHLIENDKQTPNQSTE